VVVTPNPHLGSGHQYARPAHERTSQGRAGRGACRRRPLPGRAHASPRPVGRLLSRFLCSPLPAPWRQSAHFDSRAQGPDARELPSSMSSRTLTGVQVRLAAASSRGEPSDRTHEMLVGYLPEGSSYRGSVAIGRSPRTTQPSGSSRPATVRASRASRAALRLIAIVLSPRVAGSAGRQPSRRSRPTSGRGFRQVPDKHHSRLARMLSSGHALLRSYISSPRILQGPSASSAMDLETVVCHRQRA